ncbi:MAG TPA: glycosyltransferase [Gaiellaceae bacterium]|nr:glycosyltransferase [Gaiellaceae bacterium]
MRILLVSQMYPGPEDPDLGVFVQGIERALAERGHEIERVVTEGRGGGKRRHLLLARDVRRAAKPDVVYAHFLVPTGLSAALFGGAPLVVTAHGRDVRNIGAYPGIRAATRFVARRASSVIAVSDYLRRELEAKIPEARGKTEVVDCGVDLSLFSALAAGEAPRGSSGEPPGSPEPPPQVRGAAAPQRGQAASAAGRNGPVFVCVGSLIERKNVVRLADAFATLGEGRLVFVGDGPLRPQLEGRANVEITGRVSHDEVPRYIAEATVLCQPSLIEPFGQALLEGMAAGKSVLATRVGGPPEFVPPGAGVLVDPLDTTALADGMRRAAELPRPNTAARAAAAEHDVKRQAERIESILERAARGRPA